MSETRRIEVDYLARVEGEGLDDTCLGRVELPGRLTWLQRRILVLPPGERIERAPQEELRVRPALDEALDTVKAGGGTAIFDHLYLALSQLESRQGRRVVILLTDGKETCGGDPARGRQELES